MKVHTRTTILVSMVAALALAGPTGALAHTDEHRFGAWINAGTVDDFDSDASVGRFGPLEHEDDRGDIDDFDLTGVDAAEFWEADEYVYLTIDQLLAEPHVIVVRAENNQASPVIAIGLIDGEVDARGALTISLLPVDDSGFAGLAFLEQDEPNETDIDIVIWEGVPLEVGTPVA